MTHVTCRLTAKNRDQQRNPMLCNRVWAAFTFTFRPNFWSPTKLWDFGLRISDSFSRFLALYNYVCMYVCMYVKIKWPSAVEKDNIKTSASMYKPKTKSISDCKLRSLGTKAEWSSRHVFRTAPARSQVLRPSANENLQKPYHLFISLTASTHSGTTPI